MVSDNLEAAGLESWKPFVENLATTLAAGNYLKEGIVVGLYGGWGTGKSFILDKLKKHLEEKEEFPDIQVIRFNPWYYSGQEEKLLGQFLACLGTALGIGEKEEITKNLWESLKALFLSLGPLRVDVGKLIEPWEGQQDPLEKAKEALEAVLKNSKKRTLLLIDEVDRLTPPEIALVFKMVRAVADLPSVAYLLAFDEKEVAQSLASHFGVSGEEYLEKIIQVPLHLPRHSNSEVVDFFKKLLKKDATLQGLFDKSNYLYGDYLRLNEWLNTPRKALRFYDYLRLYVPLLKDKGLEPYYAFPLVALKLFFSEEYRLFRDCLIPAAYRLHERSTAKPAAFFSERNLRSRLKDALKNSERETGGWEAFKSRQGIHDKDLLSTVNIKAAQASLEDIRGFIKRIEMLASGPNLKGMPWKTKEAFLKFNIHQARHLRSHSHSHAAVLFVEFFVFFYEKTYMITAPDLDLKTLFHLL